MSCGTPAADSRGEKLSLAGSHSTSRLWFPSTGRADAILVVERKSPRKVVERKSSSENKENPRSRPKKKPDGLLCGQ